MTAINYSYNIAYMDTVKEGITYRYHELTMKYTDNDYIEVMS